jgi:hypothetical protein
MDLDAAAEHLKFAYKAYKSARKDASLWREVHLKSLAKAKVDCNGTDKPTEERNLIRIERQWRQAWNVKC